MSRQKIEGVNFSRGNVFAIDFLNLIFTYLPVVLTYAGSLKICELLYQLLPLFIIIMLAPIIAIIVLISLIYFIRKLLPPLKEGVYPVGLKKDYLVWLLHLSLGRSVKVSGFVSLIHSFNILKILYFKALGMKVPFRFVSSLYIQIVDYGLIEIGEGTILTDEVQLSAHTMIKNKLWLKKIYIGKNVYVGTKSFLGLGTQIGDNCVIGLHNFLFNDKIPEGTHIAPFAWDRGNPKRQTKEA